MSDKANDGTNPRPEPTAGFSEASSSVEGLSEAAPRSGRRKLKKQDRESIAPARRPAIEVDVSANMVQITGGARSFGTDDKDAIVALLHQVFNATPNRNKGDLAPLKPSLAIVNGIAPRNALEGLLAAQMIGVHNMAMECLRLASLEGQTPEGIDANVHRAVRLLRTFTSQMEALNRNRGKISQPMVVGNVNVNEGGQAIVGTVERHGAEKDSVEDDTRKR